MKDLSTQKESSEKSADKKIRHTSKFLSRKFLVFITATALLILFTYKVPELAGTFIPWWGSVAVLYIGGNVAKGIVDVKEEAKSE